MICLLYVLIFTSGITYAGDSGNLVGALTSYADALNGLTQVLGGGKPVGGALKKVYL